MAVMKAMINKQELPLDTLDYEPELQAHEWFKQLLMRYATDEAVLKRKRTLKPLEERSRFHICEWGMLLFVRTFLQDGAAAYVEQVL